MFGTKRVALDGIASVFKKHFTKAGGGAYEGVALGLAGDQSPHVLWRLQHGEMLKGFAPKVWWILVGINDLIQGGCSPEVVLLGVLRIVEEIQSQAPNAIIVINGILPTAVPAIKKDKNFKQKVIKDIMKENLKGPKGATNKDELYPGELDKAKKGKFLRPITEVKDLGPTIKIINRQLKKFSDKHENVKYFEAEELFMTVNDKGKKVIDMTLLNGVYPTKEGHVVLAKQISKKLGDYLKVPSTPVSLPPEPIVAADEEEKVSSVPDETNKVEKVSSDENNDD
jgi:hypothetical protein